MTIRLRIAGIFYDQEFPAKAAPYTILDLLNDAKAGRQVPGKGGPSSTGFDFADNLHRTMYGTPGGRSIDWFSHEITSSFTSLGNKQRPAGRYTLRELRTETVDHLPVTYAWQYYVLDSTGASKSKSGNGVVSPAELPGGDGFKPYDQFKLADEDTVIWRQVAILTPEVAQPLSAVPLS